jgi:hypothetical protein
LEKREEKKRGVSIPLPVDFLVFAIDEDDEDAPFIEQTGCAAENTALLVRERERAVNFTGKRAHEILQGLHHPLLFPSSLS